MTLIILFALFSMTSVGACDLVVRLSDL